MRNRFSKMVNNARVYPALITQKDPPSYYVVFDTNIWGTRLASACSFIPSKLSLDKKLERLRYVVKFFTQLKFKKLDAWLLDEDTFTIYSNVNDGFITAKSDGYYLSARAWEVGFDECNKFYQLAITINEQLGEIN